MRGVDERIERIGSMAFRNPSVTNHLLHCNFGLYSVRGDTSDGHLGSTVGRSASDRISY